MFYLSSFIIHHHISKLIPFFNPFTTHLPIPQRFYLKNIILSLSPLTSFLSFSHISLSPLTRHEDAARHRIFAVPHTTGWCSPQYRTVISAVSLILNSHSSCSKDRYKRRETGSPSIFLTSQLLPKNTLMLQL